MVGVGDGGRVNPCPPVSVEHIVIKESFTIHDIFQVMWSYNA